MIPGVKNIAILGAAESGIGAALLAITKGYVPFVSDKGNISEANKTILDDHQIVWEEGQHSEERILACDICVKSPGIPDNAPLVQKFWATGKKVISEIEFASFHTKAKIVAITGSNGKTTTTLLTYHILKRAGFDVAVAGNVGFSWARQLAAQDREFFVLEISSFQLDGCYDFNPDIAVLTNITPDHLDRYNYDINNYVASKFRIAQNQRADQHFIFCADDPITIENIEKFKINAQQLPISLEAQETGGYVNNEGTIILSINRDNMSIDELALQGKHNMYNSMAAGLASRLLNIRKETVRESLSDFEGLEHRLEPVLEIHSIDFINDSKATNVNSTYYALESMKRPVVWIVGGVDKGNDYSQLIELVKTKVKAIVCLGKDNQKIHDEFEALVDVIVDTQSMEEAVKSAYAVGRKGDAVLLSPACASFDLFQNYEDRGNQFKEQVRRL